MSEDPIIAIESGKRGGKAHGPTQNEALSNTQQAIDLWIETAREFGDPIPEPKGRRLMYA